MADPSSYFGKGAEVEVSSDDDGFRGAWYSGTVVRAGKMKDKVVVEYKTLMADDCGKKPLRETLDVVQLRPPPPRERDRKFNFNEEVDAYYNDGWWEGVITGLLPQKRFSVFFRATREQIDFGEAELRLHREWIDGMWVPPLEEEQVPISTEPFVNEKKLTTETVKENFAKGTLIEVCSDEDGFQGAWFTATVIEHLPNGKFLVEYRSLRNDDNTELLIEEVDGLHLRPSPPVGEVVASFSLLQEVDALYNDGWWVGVISKVLGDKNYIVYFRGTSEEIEFKHSDLRLHQDWIGGRWVMASRALKLCS